MTTFITATKARNDLFKLIALAEKPGLSVAITHDGLPKVVLMSFDEFEGWMETLDIMSDSKLVRSFRAGLQDMKKGKVKGLDQIRSEMRHG